MRLPRILFAEGAQVDLVDSLGYTPLFTAVATGEHDLASLLLEKGAGWMTSTCRAVRQLGTLSVENPPNVPKVCLADPSCWESRFLGLGRALGWARENLDDDEMVDILTAAVAQVDITEQSAPAAQDPSSAESESGI
ncbi:hypothetical protein B0H67DRAFT_591557 [Lasiosphaeris hirsuta]|uniref:Uncharacterized protein n=1 Tax=Lasiosphaeris hirsuta TaxID=260670 RepID=A0AA40DLS8_9PEZI|nr:hypothetical protein B0H67DRAFT_591557 [Lasiosphaeris hirsuta]